MPKITLLKTQTVEYENTKKLKWMVKHHENQLSAFIEKIDRPGALAAIQAIAYNLIHLSRELERQMEKRSRLRVIDGKKD